MVFIQRELESEINKYITDTEIIAVVGSRQCGKTTLVNKIFERLENNGKKTSKVSFDNMQVLMLFEEDVESFIEKYIIGFDFLFIDEIQYSKDSGKKLKYIYDSQKIKLFISGSSASEISIQSIKYLVGRIHLFNLYPFSFKEYLRAKDEKLMRIYEKGNYKNTITKELNKHLIEFNTYGGYPKVVLLKDKEKKEKTLLDIYNIFLLKEVKELLGLSSDYKLINLIKALSLQMGNIINYNELSNITGFSFVDLKKYLNVLEKTFICKQIRPFFKNKRVELVKSPKIYFFDLGFRNACINNFTKERSDIGAIYENFIFSELQKRNLETKYWQSKSGAEVDFVVEKNNDLTAIEVKTNLIKPISTKAIQSFIHKYSPTKVLVLSKEFETKIKSIQYAPHTKLNKCVP
ncbi:MAG: ATP-binding protein [Candidatus Diapherotrites archaeon]|jgi:uncharacterized protein|uniref:ATP-binding protein n=1 Tax=Candidatus Iainarchaeum sp. TaxID=3101447 RepID=A0A8T5GG35_9ARCH|nr:ATP-binding protein [Candidatus Diapherotrites archaeon]MBT7241142.1 ATP-binding protein [Candidatus Diapherotrites archaeon]